MVTYKTRNNEFIHFQLDIQITHYDQYFIESHDRKFYFMENDVTENFYCKACHLLLSKNCLERDYSLISLVLVKLINMNCDKILNEVQSACFVYDN